MSELGIARVAEFWIWTTPDSIGYNGSVSSKHRVVCRGLWAQTVLHGRDGSAPFQYEDHVMVSGQLHPYCIRFQPQRRPNSRPRPYRHPHHSFYIEVADGPEDSIDYLGNLAILDAGIIEIDGWEPAPGH